MSQTKQLREVENVEKVEKVEKVEEQPVFIVELDITNIRTLLTVFELIKNIYAALCLQCTEVSVSLSEKGIEIQALEGDILLKSKLEANTFAYYSYDSLNSPTNFTIEVLAFFSRLKRLYDLVNTEQSIYIRIDDASFDTNLIIFIERSKLYKSK